MNNFDTINVDFHALRTLKLVHDLRSFSRAAARLGQNQSTISYSIERLRQTFGDPLFVREGRGIAPTTRCMEIVAGADRILDQLAQLTEPAQFDPSVLEMEMTIACNHYERAVILPAALRRLRREAPRLRLKIVNAMALGHDLLKRGDCDVLFSPIDRQQGDLFRRHLVEDGYVCVMDPSNPLAASAITVDGFARASHVFISYEATNWRPAYREVLEARGVFPKIVVDLPSSGEVGRLVRGTDLVATVPALLARTFGEGLHIAQTPFQSPLLVRQYWTQRTNRSPAHRWLRDLVAEEASVVARAHGAVEDKRKAGW